MLWLVAILLGIAMIALGVIFILMGYGAKSDIREALLKERVITGADSAIPGVLVEDLVTAEAQQDTIEAHTFGRFGPYSGMERDDPNRDVYIKGLTLRNALNLAVVGFGVADLAIGIGWVTVVLGLMIAGLAIPVHLLMMKVWRPETRLLLRPNPTEERLYAPVERRAGRRLTPLSYSELGARDRGRSHLQMLNTWSVVAIELWRRWDRHTFGI